MSWLGLYIQCTSMGAAVMGIMLRDSRLHPILCGVLVGGLPIVAGAAGMALFQ